MVNKKYRKKYGGLEMLIKNLDGNVNFRQQLDLEITKTDRFVNELENDMLFSTSKKLVDIMPNYKLFVGENWHILVRAIKNSAYLTINNGIIKRVNIQITLSVI